MATIEDRFNAAVNVIKGLPKNGSYQPSSAMMLTFYAYFKQATEGPCKQKKPNFWDIIKKAKWDAWNALGDMSRERAMQLYVEELKKIIETMSYTENVANFMGSIGELDNISFDDLEAIAPEIIKMARSHPDSPFASRGGSPQHPAAQHLNGFINGDTSSPEPNYSHQNGHTVDQSDDEYIDTVEDDPDIPLYKNQKLLSHLNRSDINLDLTRENLTPAPQQILGIMERMNADISAINQRILTLERHVVEIKNMQGVRKSSRKYPPWWPFEEISPMWFTFLILWPFLARRLGLILRRKN